MRKRIIPIVLAILAAVFYAINTPCSKLLLNEVSPTMLAAFLYLGAGVGVGIMYLFQFRKEDKSKRLEKKDLPYTIGMIVLDIAAPIFLMLGIKYGTASTASLLGNFEIVATALIALIIFKEKISIRLWIAIGAIVVASGFLTFEGDGEYQFSIGSLYVLLATLCWGLENNCTRKISNKSTYEIVVLKGIFSGLGSLIIALLLKESLPNIKYIALALLLGFVAYGLSIFMYVRAQKDLGAAKTSAYYAVAPFIGTALAFVLNGEKPTWLYGIGLLFMIIGMVFVAYDTMFKYHMHEHTHTITHTHDGTTHTHVIVHIHGHSHLFTEEKHGHTHDYMDSEEHKLAHNTK